MEGIRAKTFQEIVDKYLKGKYDTPVKIGYKPEQLPIETVIDEDKSVRWNREEVTRINGEKRIEFEKMKSMKKFLAAQYRSDLSAAALNECGINSKQAEFIYTYVMDHTEYDYMSVEFTIDYEKFCKVFARLRDMKEEQE